MVKTARPGLLGLVIFSGLLTLSAHAAVNDELARIENLINRGDLNQAGSLVSAYLAKQPKSVRGRFYKGVILARRNEVGPAIDVFKELTGDSPGLVEAYNNLAVLYARKQNFDEARLALENGIKADPVVDTVNGNLRATYAQLASQAYDKALRQPLGERPAKPLKLVTALRSSKLAEDEREIPAKTQPPGPKNSTEGGASSPAVSAATSVSTVPPATAVATPTAKPKTAPPLASTDAPVVTSAAEQEVNRALSHWQSAWVNKDMKDYLAAYAPEFTPPNGLERGAWELERTRKIQGRRERIHVTISGVTIETKGDSAVVRFHQKYSAGSYADRTFKTITFVNRGGRWLIGSEKVN